MPRQAENHDDGASLHPPQRCCSQKNIIDHDPYPVTTDDDDTSRTTPQGDDHHLSIEFSPLSPKLPHTDRDDDVMSGCSDLFATTAITSTTITSTTDTLASHSNNSAGKRCSRLHRSVELHNVAGHWVLDVINTTLDVAAFAIPFGECVKEVRNKIRNVHSKFHANEGLSDSLVVAVDRYGTLVDETLRRLNRGRDTAFCDRFLPEFEALLEECITIFEAIHFRCGKWLDKKFLKRLISHDRYNRDLSALKQQLEDNHKTLDSFFHRIVEANNEIRHDELVRRMKQIAAASDKNAAAHTAVRQLEDRIFAKVEQELRAMATKADENTDKLIQETQAFAYEHLNDLLSKLKHSSSEKIVSPDRHNNALTVAAATTTLDSNRETHERLRRVELKTEECLDAIQEQYARGEAKSKGLLRLSHSESSGSRSTVSEIQSNGSDASNSNNGYNNIGDPIENDVVLSNSELAGWTVEKVWICSGALEARDTGSAIKYAARLTRGVFGTIRFVAFVLPVRSAELAVQVFNERVARTLYDPAWRFAQNNGLRALCHYWAEIQLSNGTTCWMDRTAEHQDPNDRHKVIPMTGVHLRWGKKPRVAARKQEYSPKRQVTLADLVAFRDGEQGQPYNTLKNNCKHFCFHLIQDLIGINKFKTFAEFTEKHNLL